VNAPDDGGAEDLIQVPADKAQIVSLCLSRCKQNSPNSCSSHRTEVLQVLCTGSIASDLSRHRIERVQPRFVGEIGTESLKVSTALDRVMS
jgi:hypothetical protein